MHEVLSSQFWALEDTLFDRMSQIFIQRMDQGKDMHAFIEGLKSEAKPLAEAAISASITLGYDEKSGLNIFLTDQGDRIARIPMVGAMTKNGGLCSRGSAQIAAMIERADASDTIDAILLFTDGPGGTVSGTPRLASAIRSAIKPTISFVDEMAASAHLWAISQSDYIVGNSNEYTMIGSIGVLSVMVNEKERLEKKGTKVLVMRGNRSVDKSILNSAEEWPEAALMARQTELNQINDDFIESVKQGRGSRITSEEVFSGKMYYLDQAIELGLADYQGSLVDAIELAVNVAKSRKKR